MENTTITQNLTATFNEITDAIENDGHKVTMMIEGEPGIGKSSLGKEVARRKGFRFAYIDTADKSLGDLMYPVPNHENQTVGFYPNEALEMHYREPVVIMLDEWTKANREVKNMTLPLVLERRLGSIPLHPDSIVFATGNMTRDGVGDSIQAHQRNRFVPVQMAKPTAEEWINNFAIDAGIDPTVIAFADQFPQVFESYLNDPNMENPYIFNPKRQQASYCSPRSMEKVSDMIKTRGKKSENMLFAQAVGAIGASGAADLMNFVRMNEELPPFANIIADPEHCMIPSQPVNRLLLTFSLLVRSDKDNITPLVKYMERFNNEMQALFFNKLLSTQSKSVWACHVPAVGQRVTKLHHVF